MQDVQNCGSLLQAYALKMILRKMGHVVEFIPIEPNENDNCLMSGYTENYQFESGNSGILGKIKHLDRYTFNRVKNRKLSKCQDKKFDEFRWLKLYERKTSTFDAFDYCVIGSDEVFNCCAESSWGFTTQLFGNVKEARKVITYAASCGSTEIAKIPTEVLDRIKDTLSTVVALSVRDNNTNEFVKSICGIAPNIHLDPVLIYNFSKEEIAAQTYLEGRKYCIVYSYVNRINKKDDIEAIKYFCRNHNLEIVAVGAPQAWIQNYFVGSPFEVLALFKKAEFVVTDTFHGAIFSAKFVDKFAVIVRDSNRNKLQDLINRIQITGHQCRGFHIDELEHCWNCIHDKANFNMFIEREQKRSLEYLNQNIK